MQKSIEQKIINYFAIKNIVFWLKNKLRHYIEVELLIIKNYFGNVSLPIRRYS